MTGLFDGMRMSIEEAIRLTTETLRAVASAYDTWVFAWSGGKDSTATLTLCLSLIESGAVPRPNRIVVLYADTRQELLPLAHVATAVIEELRDRGIEAKVVTAPLDRRMWVYILGRGVPPPNNNTLRYCTRQIKIEPMAEQVRQLAVEAGRKVLVMTGVRTGESAARDARIALACSTNGAECGQGHFLQVLGNDHADTLAPLIHWRVCHVWAWLRNFAPDHRHGEWPTKLLADAYGGEEAEEVNARTGCVCCPLASADRALDAVTSLPHWSYLAPLKRIRTEIYEWLRLPANRLRKPGGETRKDGSLCANQNRMGPIHLDARMEGLRRLISIQSTVNETAHRLGRPLVDHLNNEEASRIRELIQVSTWPDGWRGNEPKADEPFDPHYADGSVQKSLF